MQISQLTARRPYLLRAFYEWFLDNHLTPHLVVDINLPGVMVPLAYAHDGRIVLNIVPTAVSNLELGNDKIRFSARFGGVLHQISIPLIAILAIYARENGSGIMFEREPIYDDYGDTAFDSSGAKDESAEIVMSVIDGDYTDDGRRTQDDYHSPNDESPTRSNKRPALRIVK